jgi:SAM-dependent methyltransferase
LLGATEALPLQSDSVDVLLMPHALDLAEDPHQVLREAHRVLAPEGYLILSGFNPWSLAGLAKLLRRGRAMPWSSSWLAPGRVKDWLALLGFAPRSTSSPWMQSMANRIGIEPERVPHLLGGQPLHALASGLYALVAQKHVVWIRPVVSRWRRRPRLAVVGLAEPAARAQRDAHSND